MSDVKLVPIMEATDTVEADFIISYLASYDVHAEKHYSGAGEYMHIFMGFSSEGAVIAVPEDQLDRAKEALDKMELDRKSRRDRTIED